MIQPWEVSVGFGTRAQLDGIDVIWKDNKLRIIVMIMPTLVIVPVTCKEDGHTLRVEIGHGFLQVNLEIPVTNLMVTQTPDTPVIKPPGIIFIQLNKQ